MAFDPNELNTENTPARWRIQGKRLAENGVEGAAEMAKLDSVYQAVLTKAATFTSDAEMGVGNQPGVGSEPDDILVTGITIEEATAQGFTMDLDLTGGGSNVEELNLNAIVLPANATDSGVTFTSADPGVASISPVNGLMTAVSVGTTLVTATANDGSGVTETQLITVEDVA